MEAIASAILRDRRAEMRLLRMTAWYAVLAASESRGVAIFSLTLPELPRRQNRASIRSPRRQAI